MQTYPALFPSMGHCLKQTLYAEGISRGLYAGTVPALVANITENSILFMCYGMCQKFMQRVTNTKSVDQLGALSNATAGFLAAFFSSIAITPTELVKCKLQAMHEKNKLDSAAGKKVQYLGPVKLTSLIVKEDGCVGLFRGLGPTLVREMPGYFFFFGGYEGNY